MNEEVINRTYLESLSFSELSHLADEYGIDVPEDLDRRFLIAELLEINEEEDNDSKEEMIISSNEEEPSKDEALPKNYNESQISCVLRNPVWLFVFWNRSESDSLMLKKIQHYTLMLRVCFFDTDEEDAAPVDAFEVQAAADKQEQYILLPGNKKFLKVELVYTTATGGKVLAFSPVIKIPQGSQLVNDSEMGFDSKFSEIVQLSDIQTVLSEQYKNHRHSFE